MDIIWIIFIIIWNEKQIRFNALKTLKCIKTLPSVAPLDWQLHEGLIFSFIIKSVLTLEVLIVWQLSSLLLFKFFKLSGKCSCFWVCFNVVVGSVTFFDCESSGAEIVLTRSLEIFALSEFKLVDPRELFFLVPADEGDVG